MEFKRFASTVYGRKQLVDLRFRSMKSDSGELSLEVKLQKPLLQNFIIMHNASKNNIFNLIRDIHNLENYRVSRKYPFDKLTVLKFRVP